MGKSKVAAERPGAEADDGYFRSVFAEDTVFHIIFPQVSVFGENRNGDFQRGQVTRRAIVAYSQRSGTSELE